MTGSLFAFMAGALITLQGVANARISQDIGMWQAAALTQVTGFVAALLILSVLGDGRWRTFGQVKPLYLAGGSFAAIIIFTNIIAMRQIGVTLTISSTLIAQLGLTFLIDKNGWLGVVKQEMKLPQLVGLGLMIAGVVILRL